jgi:hypothetical protein
MRSYLFESMSRDHRTHANWGQFMVLVPDGVEWTWHSHITNSMTPALEEFGWTPGHVIVMDLRTGEAAMYLPGDGEAAKAMTEHRIFTSPQFKYFLEWLYEQDVAHLYQQPNVIELPDVTHHLSGWRDIGPLPISITLKKGEVVWLQFGGGTHPVVVDDITETGAVIRSLTAEEKDELGLAGPPPEPEEPSLEETQVIPVITDQTRAIDIYRP